MINYNSSSALRAFLEQNNLGMQKKFGQNFLVNPEIRKSLADALGAKSGDEVWEIGPGLGAMTALLFENGNNVKAFEIDTGFIRVLKDLFKDKNNFSLIEGDVLKTWEQEWEKEKSANGRFLLGNLPYNIAASLIADFIEKGCVFSRMVVTVQKEVALRMSAKPGSKDYSSFSVLCGSVYKIKPLMTIHSSSFYPKPNVDSMGVLLEANLPPEPYPKTLYPLIRALFSSRRKTIKNNLINILSVPWLASKPCLCVRLFSDNNLTGNERAETLELSQFVSLARSLENLQ